MTVKASTFREHYTEFADVTKFPDSLVGFWISIATQLVNADRWGTLTDSGVELFVAHNIVLEIKAQKESDNGAPPGLNTGIINNKSVDKVSYGYDTTASLELEAGHWNLTIYGTRFIRLARMMGAGAIQIGIGFDPTGGLGSANAWPGPWPWNFPNPTP